MVGNSGGDPAVQDEALRRFRAFAADPVKAPIPADLRATVYAIAAKKGSDEDRAALLRLYRASDLQEEKNRLLSVLGLVDGSDAAALDRVRAALAFLLSDEVRPGNVAFLMSGVGQSAAGRAEAWEWFQRNFPTIQERWCKGQNFLVAGLLNAMLSGWASKGIVAEFEAFFAKDPIPQANFGGARVEACNGPSRAVFVIVVS